MSEKKGPASKISRLITLSIVGEQKRKDVSSHVHIIILQKSVLVLIPQSKYVDVSTLTTSDLESSDDEECFSL